MWADFGLCAAIVAGCLLSRKRYQDIFTPLFLYVLVWCTCLFLFRLRLVNYDELQTKTILIVAWSMLAFVLGCLSAGTPGPSRPPILEIALPALERWIKILVFVNLAGLLLFAFRMAGTFGISAYFNDPNAIRLNYEDLGRIGMLAVLLLVNYPLFLCSLIHSLQSKKLHWFSALGLCLPAAQGYLAMSRNLLAIPLATGFLVWCYFNGWRTLNKKVLTRSALVLSLIAAYFILVGSWYGKNVSDNSSFNQQDFSVSSQVALQFVDPYIYATCAFPTLQAAIQDVRGHLWGTRTFFPIARFLYAVGFLSDRPENASLEFYFVPIPSNVSTYLFTIYEDFGVTGLIVCPFLLGLIATKIYLRMRAESSIFSIGGCACLMVVILYSVFIALASTFQVWYCLLLLFVISRQCSVRSQAIPALTNRPAYSTSSAA